MPRGPAGGSRNFAETSVILVCKGIFKERRFEGDEELLLESSFRQAKNMNEFIADYDFPGLFVTTEAILSKQGEMEGGKKEGVEIFIDFGDAFLLRDDISQSMKIIEEAVPDIDEASYKVDHSKIVGPIGGPRPLATTGFMMLVSLTDSFYDAIPSIPNLEAEVRNQTNVRTLDITAGTQLDAGAGAPTNIGDNTLLVNPDARSATLDYMDRVVRAIDDNIPRAGVDSYMLMLNGGTEIKTR